MLKKSSNYLQPALNSFAFYPQNVKNTVQVLLTNKYNCKDLDFGYVYKNNVLLLPKQQLKFHKAFLPNKKDEGEFVKKRLLASSLLCNSYECSLQDLERVRLYHDKLSKNQVHLG